MTIVFVRIFNHYKSLTKGVDSGNLEKILKQILANENLKDSEILDINKRIKVLQQGELTHIQKVSMFRFNPFNETGGDNSFTICLLDGNANGIVMTGLHTREKTRMYAKQIVNGKSKYELSREEAKAVNDALK